MCCGQEAVRPDQSRGAVGALPVCGKGGVETRGPVFGVHHRTVAKPLFRGVLLERVAGWSCKFAGGGGHGAGCASSPIAAPIGSVATSPRVASINWKYRTTNLLTPRHEASAMASVTVH